MSEPSSVADQITAKLKALNDWRGDTLAQLRGLILQADPAVSESLKWAKASNPTGVPTWEHNGILCTGEIYKAYVKLTFAHGAALDDPTGLFNAGFGGGTRRAIDIHEGGTVDSAAFIALIQAAIAFNQAKKNPGKAGA